jgi:hypothetical protein
MYRRHKGWDLANLANVAADIAKAVLASCEIFLLGFMLKIHFVDS